MTRPFIRNNTLVTATGQPLRGDSLLAFRGNWGTRIIDRDFGDDHAGWTRGECRNIAYYRTLRDKFGLNCVRMFCYRDIRKAFPGNWFQWAELIPVIDAAVTICAELGMVLVIDYHSVPCGKNNWSMADPTTNNTDDAWLPPGLTSFGQDSREFWSYVAPRYKDVEHVVYEIHNEPIQWSTTYLNTYYSNKPAIQYQADMYTLVRSLAPATPLLMWSFAQARGRTTGTRDLWDVVSRDNTIRYDNALVAWHGYAMDKASVMNLAASYPQLMTEYTDASAVVPNWGNFQKMLDWLEGQGIGWIALNLAWTSRQPQMQGQVLKTDWKNIPPVKIQSVRALRNGTRTGVRMGVGV